jgi:hypothetical protein
LNRPKLLLHSRLQTYPRRVCTERENILVEETSTTPSIPVDRALDDTPEPRAPKDETSRSPILHLAFEDDPFEDYGNTSNYQCRGKPSIPVTPPDPEEIVFFRNTDRELTTILTQEWSKSLSNRQKFFRLSRLIQPSLHHARWIDKCPLQPFGWS